jgi:hypothetical protein
MYTRAMSCIMLPGVPPTAEELEMWQADDYKILREWVERFGDKRSVTAAHHAAAVEFLESYDGKDALMAGLQVRYQIMNNHPFYDPAAFSAPQAFADWKVNEIDCVERQKNVLVKFQKTELIVRCARLPRTHPLH